MIPSEFARLVRHAETAGKLNRSQIAEQLGLPESKLIELTTTEFPSDAIAKKMLKIAKVVPSDNLVYYPFSKSERPLKQITLHLHTLLSNFELQTSQFYHEHYRSNPRQLHNAHRPEPIASASNVGAEP